MTRLLYDTGSGVIPLDGGYSLTIPAATSITGGGTIALGSYTLTVAGTSSIAGTLSGGGTVATGGFTLTVPATGTAAMGAGTLTVSTTNNATIAAHTHAITSSSNPGAAARILASNSTGGLQLTRIGLSTAPSALAAITAIQTITDPATTAYGIYNNPTFNFTAASASRTVNGYYSWSALTAGAGVVASNAVALASINRNIFLATSSHVVGFIAQQIGGMFLAGNSGTGRVIEQWGNRIDSGTNTGGGTVDINYGLEIQDQTAGTTNYSLLVRGGPVVLNENGTAAGDFRAEADTEPDMILLDASADALYLGGQTNGIKIDKGGELTLIGTATRWDDLRIEPVVRGTGAKNPAFEVWLNGVYLYSFDDATAGSEKEVWFQVQMPHSWKEGSTVEPHVHWTNKTAGTAGQVIRWGIEYTKAAIGGTFGATTTIYGTTIVGGGDITVANEHLLTDFAGVDMTGDTLSTVIACRLFRNSSNAADTYTGTAGLLYIDWHYEIDALGSKTELSK